MQPLSPASIGRTAAQKPRRQSAIQAVLETAYQIRSAMTDTQAKPTLEMQRNRAEQEARPNLEKWRNEAEQQASKTLDKDAMAAIEQTLQAIDCLAAGKTADALKSIEEATGKVNIVL